MSSHHNYTDEVPDPEQSDARQAATSQQQVAEILRSNPDHAFGYFEIQAQTGVDRASAGRSLSNLSGSHPRPEKIIDEFGNWPVIYNPARRKRNPGTGRTVGTYRWNPLYGVRPPEREVEPGGQLPLFASEHKSAYSGVD